MSEDRASTRSAETRRLAAIMFTDMVGFSRQMGSDEACMLRLLDVHNQFIWQAVAEYYGTVIKTVGDAFLVDFPSVVNAVQCAQRIQTQFRSHNAEKEAAEQIHVRIGIHSGDIVQKEGDVFGDGVNIASRLQALAEPDAICLSHVVYKEVEKKLPLGTVVSLGRPKLKGIAERFPVYALLPQQSTGLPHVLRRQGRKLHRAAIAHLSWAALVVGVMVGGALIALLLPSSITRTPFPTPRTQTALSLPDKPSIAVLPFTNMSGDPEQEYFSDGLTDDLITDLSKLSGLFVIARYSVFTYKGKTVKVQDVSQELGVRYVVEGSVRKMENRVLITAQLIDATTGGHVWSERYDRPLQDLFALQEEIRRKIVVHLALKLTDVEHEHLERAYTSSPDAYDYCLRGRKSVWSQTKETNIQARQMFERAIALDPSYAQAYALLGWTYFSEWAFQWSQDPQALEQAFTLTQKALALDDSLPGAHDVMGVIYLWRNRQYEQAIAEEERAITLGVSFTSAYASMGMILNFAGRPQEAIGFQEQAMRLDPRHPGRFANYLTTLGVSYRLLGRHEEAGTVLKKALTLNPNQLGAHMFLASIYSELGREDEAQAEAAEVLRISPNFSLAVWQQRLPFKDPAETEHLFAALRKAGLK